MSRAVKRDIPASVRARLLKLAATFKRRGMALPTRAPDALIEQPAF